MSVIELQWPCYNSALNNIQSNETQLCYHRNKFHFKIYEFDISYINNIFH